MIDRWLLSSAAPLEVYGPPGSARLVSGTPRAFHPVELAPVMIGGPVKPPLSRTALAHDLPSRLDAPTLIYQDALVRVIAATIDHYHYPRGSRDARFSRSYASRIDRQSVMSGTSVAASLDLGGRRTIKKQSRKTELHSYSK